MERILEAGILKGKEEGSFFFREEGEGRGFKKKEKEGCNGGGHNWLDVSRELNRSSMHT